MAVQIVTDSIVPLACARHLVDLAVEILVSDFACPLHLKVFRYGHFRTWLLKRHMQPPAGELYTTLRFAQPLSLVL